MHRPDKLNSKIASAVWAFLLPYAPSLLERE
jgi:hypothetical protein